jgi:arginine/serine-rich splicing factor 1/9
VRTKDVEDLFYKYGKMNFVDLKNRKGPPFAFIEFDDVRDAQDAVKSRDGYNYDGYKLRVEFSKGPRFDSSSDYKSRDMGSRNAISARRTEYRCLITGLPPTGSWQDLKDHMREAGNVCYSDVFKDGTGVVEFTKYEDMKYAIRVLDDSKFRSHEVNKIFIIFFDTKIKVNLQNNKTKGETSYIRVRMDSKTSRSRSRSRSRSAPRRAERSTPSYSPVRKSSAYRGHSSRSRSRTRSHTRSHSKTRSHTRSQSRSLRRSRSKLSPSRSPSRSPRNRSRSND